MSLVFSVRNMDSAIGATQTQMVPSQLASLD